MCTVLVLPSPLSRISFSCRKLLPTFSRSSLAEVTVHVGEERRKRKKKRSRVPRRRTRRKKHGEVRGANAKRNKWEHSPTAEPHATHTQITPGGAITIRGHTNKHTQQNNG
jgi:hypothetical protein